MKQTRILKIVVASPGDVQAERDMIPTIVDGLNKGIADERAEPFRPLSRGKVRQQVALFC